MQTILDNTTVIIPSHNTLEHLKNTYTSVRKYYPTIPMIIIDDASTDGTDHWLRSLTDIALVIIIDPERKGHTFWYDEGMRRSTTEIVSILHSDMMIGPNYFENMAKHLRRGSVVCATRVEPPIHPEGKEKIVRNFGMDHHDYKADEFEQFCIQEQQLNNNITTEGIFAPWMLYKDDHLSIGGHDQNFAPYGYEDSDIFNRWILNGYQMIQSRDSLVYHLTCRGHRWNKGIGIENADYKDTMERGKKYFRRKWNQWIQNDEYQHPIIFPKYNIRLIAHNVTNIQYLQILEPLFCHIACDNNTLINQYILQEQGSTLLDMSRRISLISDSLTLTDYDVNVTIDIGKLTNEDLTNLQQMNLILTQLEDSSDVGSKYEIGNISIQVNTIRNIINTLIYVEQ